MNARKHITRRSGLVTGGKLAFAAPAIVAGLRGGTVFASNGSGGTGSGNSGSNTHSATLDTTSAVLGTSTGTVSTTNTGTNNDTTTSNTTTTVTGETAGLQVLGRARLCRLANGGAEHRNAGKLRLLSGSSGVRHLHVHIRGAGTRSVTFFGSPNGVLNGTVLQLTHGRGVISGLSDDQVSKLLVANSKDFQSGFHFQITEGNQVHNFVACPHPS